MSILCSNAFDMGKFRVQRIKTRAKTRYSEETVIIFGKKKLKHNWSLLIQIYLCFGSLSLGFVLLDRLFFLGNCSWFVLIKRGDSSAELLLLRKVKVPITYRCSVSNSPTRRSVQPLFGGTRSQFGRESCLKVKFCF